jgi:hypothetical protein
MSFNPSNDNKRYIIQLKKDVNIQPHFTRLREMRNPPAFTVSHTYSPSFLNAYVGESLNVAHTKDI